ncbi:MAG TPA: DUF2975 domain-containing protein [Caulobacteraceae bacterium]|jgi:hypothetical protein|nr:DUF2975 domain-containing protein [Caulobacteraceae bacterium]
MRALGPGSVSSFLKVILDVVYVALAISIVLIAIGMIVTLLFDVDPALFSNMIRAGAPGGALTGPEIAGELLVGGLYAGGVLAIVGQLRRLFATLTAGDPFHPANVRRLRTIGLLLAALGVLEMVRYPLTLLDAKLATHRDLTPNVTTWFAVLVVFVLAEVFREGARLRHDAELTI